MRFEDLSAEVLVGIICASMSFVTFFAYGIDKLKAKHGAWRISEKALLGLGILGGALGGLIGMKIWHHKTKHKYFWAINFMALGAQIALILALAKR